MAEYEAVIAVATVSTFVLGGLRYTLLETVKKKKERITKEIQNKMATLLKSHSNKLDKDKKDFILDLVGLYHLENRLKTSEREFRNIVYGFIGIIFSSLIYAFAGASSFPVIFFIGEFSLVPIVMGFGSLYTTVRIIEKYEDDVSPREFAKRLRI
jgi:hypothetical protein